MEDARFWETKNLRELNETEWEALCDGCARCCFQRKENAEAVQPDNICSLCYLLDIEPCRCSDYANRKRLVPNCIVLSPDRPELFEQMPETCAYRLRHEGKPLPDWHPLVTGDPASALPHKVVVHGKMNLEIPAPTQAPTSAPAPTPALTSAPAPAQALTSVPAPTSAPAPAPTIQTIAENTIQMEEKTSQMAEDAKYMICNALNTVETTSLAGKFLTSTSHEIRTALHGILGMAQLISDTELTPEQRDCIDTLLQSTTGLLKTLNYVLDISKIESGQMDICETALDLHSLCGRVHRMFRPLAEQKGLDFKCECQRNVPLSVMCDKGLVERVLENLVGLALEQAHHGSVFFNIDCHKKSMEGADLIFEITDTSAGIDEEQPSDMLENPEQTDAGSFQQLLQKADMDLAVCKQLIELMDGSLDLVSTEDKGSMFRIKLTFRQANFPASFKGDKAKTITRPDVRVLLAEDNKVNQKVVISVLHKAGCEVDTVGNGADALRKIQESHYDMVLMDCQMPVMDGFNATTRIRAMDKPTCMVPIIALTAHAMKDDKQKCLDSGMDDFLPKPVGRQDLIDIVNKYTAS